MSNKHFNIAGGYSYQPNLATTSQIRELGVNAAQSHGRLIRDAVERAICRFYHVPSLQDCNADSILDAGNHEYHEGIPFRVIDLSGQRFVIQDLKTKREICFVGQFQVEREEMDISQLGDSVKRVGVFMNIQQSYITFDGVK